MSYLHIPGSLNFTQAPRNDDIELEDRGSIFSKDYEQNESSSDDADVGGDVLYSREDAKRVVKKFDRYLVSFLAVLYMLSFLDRSNIGNARIAGMVEDLDISPEQYEWLLTGFYITYILFEWMTLCWKMFSPHKYISICVAGWGLIACLQGLVPNYKALFVCRAALGVAEAAFGPGVPFYLSFFYKREELAFRTGLFISAAPLSTAYAGSLAYLLTSIRSRLAPWRLLFIVEGWPSLVAALVAWWWAPDSPDDAWFLNKEEQRVATLRLLTATQRGKELTERTREADHGDERTPKKRGLRWHEVFAAAGDSKNWLTALQRRFFFAASLLAYHYQRALSAPPYLLAFVVVIATSYLSDRFHTRSTFVIGHSLVGALGYAVLAAAPRDWRWRYAAVYLAASGIFSAIAIIIPWTVGNSESAEGRGTGVAILNLVGQCGPLLGTRLYPNRDGPYYRKGMTICSVFMGIVCVLALTLRIILMRENNRREAAYQRRLSLEGDDSTHDLRISSPAPSIRRGKKERGFRFMI